MPDDARKWPGLVAAAVTGAGAVAAAMFLGVLAETIPSAWAQRHSRLLWGIGLPLFVAAGLRAVIAHVGSGRRDLAATRTRLHSNAVALPLAHSDAQACPSIALDPDRAITRFRGRRLEQRTILNWALSADQHPFLLLTGQALVGKTRLVSEVTRRLPNHWLASRLLPSADGETASLAEALGPHLIAIELDDGGRRYANFINRAAIVATSSKLKVVLISRNPRMVDFLGEDLTSHARREVKNAQRSNSIDLLPHGNTQDHLRWQREAADQFLAAQVAPRLARFDQPAYGAPIGLLHAEVLAAALSTDRSVSDTTDVSSRVQDLLASNEMAHWSQHGIAEPLGMLRQSAFSSAWLLGAQSFDELIRSVEAIGISDSGLTSLCLWLTATYPGSSYRTFKAPNQLIARAISIPCLSSDPDLTTRLLTGLDTASSIRVIIRLLDSSPSLEGESDQVRWLVDVINSVAPTGKRLSRVLRQVTLVAAAGGKLDDLAVAVLGNLGHASAELDGLLSAQDGLSRLPKTLLSLRELKLNQVRTRAHSSDQLARELTLSASALLNVGDALTALERLDEAVILWTQVEANLAHDHRDRISTHILRANVLAVLGRQQSSADAACEALTLARELPSREQTREGVELGQALNECVFQLYKNGQRSQAYVLASEAAVLWRRLEEDTHGSEEPGLARCLSNLSIMQAADGDLILAAETAGEAVAIRRRLTKDDPATHRRDLAMSLNNYGVRLDAVERFNEGFAAMGESLAHWHSLLLENPNIHVNGWAMANHNYATDLAERGHVDRALSTHKSVIKLRRRLHRQNLASSADLVSSLHAYAHTLMQHSRPDAAIEVLEEASTILRSRMSDHLDGDYRPLSQVLSCLSEAYSKLNKSKEAAKAAVEADHVQSLARD
ncbi:MAG: hypothetical protein ACRCYU_08845 [Nocardioides sp.]